MSNASEKMKSLNSNEKRILKDVIKITRNPLISNGIFYSHDVDNLYKGYSMIIGPKDTIYKHGFYFF